MPRRSVVHMPTTLLDQPTALGAVQVPAEVTAFFTTLRLSGPVSFHPAAHTAMVRVATDNVDAAHWALKVYIARVTGTRAEIDVIAITDRPDVHDIRVQVSYPVSRFFDLLTSMTGIRYQPGDPTAVVEFFDRNQSDMMATVMELNAELAAEFDSTTVGYPTTPA